MAPVAQTLVAIPVLKTFTYRCAQMQKEIELQALICERCALVAENEYRAQCGHSPAYVSGDFMELAERMRALNTVE